MEVAEADSHCLLCLGFTLKKKQNLGLVLLKSTQNSRRDQVSFLGWETLGNPGEHEKHGKNIPEKK